MLSQMCSMSSTHNLYGKNKGRKYITGRIRLFLGDGIEYNFLVFYYSSILQSDIISI